MPVTEFDEHKWFWDNFRWGMQDDLISIGITNQIKTAAPKADVKPWMVKHWTVQKHYTYQVTHLITKPAASIRRGFMAICNAVKAMTHGGQHK